MNLRQLPSLRIGLLLLCGVLHHPLPAIADAVPAPPDKCPKGQIGITSHAGPQCVEPAPKNCPPGWIGQIRGICIIHSCETDANCGTGKQCREVDLCLQEFIQEWGYTAADPPRNRPLFAGPPVRYDPPRHVIRPVDVCGKGHSCADPAKCGRGKVCLPVGVNSPGFWTGKR